VTEKERRAATNTGFASGGVTCKLGALCFYSSVVLVDSFVLRNPARTQSPKTLCAIETNRHNMNMENKIQRAETNLQRKLDWIGRHDGRTTFVTGIIIAMLGILTSASSKIEIWTWFICSSFAVTAVLLFISLFFIYKSQYPKIKSQNTSLIYFGTVAEMKFDEFKRRTLSTNDHVSSPKVGPFES